MLDHHLRRLVLRHLHASDGPMSPAALSRKVGIPVTNLSYHFNTLRQHCILEMVDERPVRGAIEHLFESRVAENPLALKILRKTRAEDKRRR